MKRHRRAPSAGGFSVFELLVSFAILLVAMAIAGRLLLEAQARMAHSARQALEPAAQLALKQIRADVRAASGVAATDNEWSWQPMVLVGHPMGTVVYERLGDELVRKVGGGGARSVMRSVSVFRWRLSRSAPLPLVEIELGHREIPRFGLLAAAGQREAPIPVTRSHLLAINPRQSARNGW
jgi:type II secretory pathway pseudopilin PulG